MDPPLPQRELRDKNAVDKNVFRNAGKYFFDDLRKFPKYFTRDFFQQNGNLANIFPLEVIFHNPLNFKLPTLFKPPHVLPCLFLVHERSLRSSYAFKIG